MLTIQEIKDFIEKDSADQLKKQAKVGQDYYEGRHDILDLRLFYYNADGQLVEDKYRSNKKICHPFFTELVDQAVQYIMSGGDIFKSDMPELQTQLNAYFNDNESFMSELAETLTGMQSKGFDYMYAYKGEDDKLCFANADCLGVIEVEGRFAEDGKDQFIYRYVDRVDKEGKTQWKIRNIDDENTYYYRQADNGDIEPDDVEFNPRPHKLYMKKGQLFKKPFGFLPMFGLDNNKKRVSHLQAVKALIDDYDIHASSLTNNLIDFDTPLLAVKGFQGDNLDELQQNTKTKKLVGLDEDGGIEIQTVAIPYEARKIKLDLDKESIYHFGMGLNTTGLKDTTATTNIAIKMAYSLLDLRCSKIINQLKPFLRKILKVVLAEINEQQGTDYQDSQVWFNFNPEIMANVSENAQNALTEAQEQQTRINTLLGLATYFDNETLMQNICDVLDLDYEELKDKLPDPDEAANSLGDVAAALGGVVGE